MSTWPAGLEALHRARPRSRFVRASLGAFGALLVGSFLLSGVDWSQALGPDAARHLERFGREVRPRPVRDAAWDWGVVFQWVADRFAADDAMARTVGTLAISVLAIVLAMLVGGLLAPFAARNLMAPSPFGRSAARDGGVAQLVSRAGVAAMRVVLVLLRCLPEYLLAFLLVSVFGYTAWPAVLALAIHNTGILGRLGAETIENLPPRPSRALRDLGALRSGLVAASVVPVVLPRWLLYVFYRWETCVREATVLGLLNLPALGWLIDEAQVRSQKDVLLLYVLLAAALVLVGDLVSSVLRRAVRRA